MFIASEIFCAAAAFFVPMIAVIAYCIMVCKGWKWAGLGAVCYVIFHMLIWMPILTLLVNDPKVISYFQEHLIQFALLSCMVPVLLEEAGRFLIMKFIMGSNNTNMDGLGFGLGLGAIESCLLVGFDSLLFIFSQPDALSIENLLCNGMERLSFLIFQVGWSLMMMKCVREKKWKYFFIVLLEHMAVYFYLTLSANFFDFSAYLIEIILLAFALWMGWYVYKVFKPVKKMS